MPKKMRDGDRESKFVLELRKQNKKLVAENGQLRKRIRILENQPAESDEVVSEFIFVSQTDRQISCPDCGGYTKNLFEIRKITYYRCESCGSKGRAPSIGER